MNALDVAERANFGTITPAAAMFKQIGDVAFGFMLPVLAGFIAMAIGDRPALALGFVGGIWAKQWNIRFSWCSGSWFCSRLYYPDFARHARSFREALENRSVLIYPVVGILVMDY